MSKENKEILTSINNWEIQGRVLCIFDIHQNIEWAKAVIELERGNYDHILFGGDFFDSFWEPPRVSSVEETAKFVLEVQAGVYGPATCLLGNHDLTYLEVWRSTHLNRNPKYVLNYCSGYTNSKANKINKILTWTDWKKFKLFALCNGWLLTHAGLRANNFRPFMDPKKSLDVLEQEFNEAINHVTAFAHHLFAVGMESGGRCAFGGPLWCRPDTFEDELPYPQIFGHTHTGKGHVKQYARCFCIDGGQTTYAIINTDGKVNFKSARKMEINTGNHEHPYILEAATHSKHWTTSERIKACDDAIAKLNLSKNPESIEKFMEEGKILGKYIDEVESRENQALKNGETFIIETPEEYLKRLGQ